MYLNMAVLDLGTYSAFKVYPIFLLCFDLIQINFRLSITLLLLFIDSCCATITHYFFIKLN